MGAHSEEHDWLTTGSWQPPEWSPGAAKSPHQAVGILCVSSDAHAPASASPFCAAEAQLFTPLASTSRKMQHSRCCHMDSAEQLPVVGDYDCFSHSAPESTNKTNNRLSTVRFGVSLLDDDVDWENLFAPSEQGRIKDHYHSPKKSKAKTVGSSSVRSGLVNFGIVIPELNNSETVSPNIYKSETVFSKTVNLGGKNAKPTLDKSLFAFFFASLCSCSQGSSAPAFPWLRSSWFTAALTRHRQPLGSCCSHPRNWYGCRDSASRGARARTSWTSASLLMLLQFKVSDPNSWPIVLLFRSYFYRCYGFTRVGEQK